MNVPVLPEDSINIYAYKYAGDSENAIKIGDFVIDSTDPTNRTYLCNMINIASCKLFNSF